MKDIQNQEDLYVLVNQFYNKLLADDRINYIFTDVVKIKLNEHLPILVNFWSQGILGTGGYTKNLTQIHLAVNEKEYLSPELFEIWMDHFNTIVNENFMGTNAEEIKKQALQIATIMQLKISKT